MARAYVYEDDSTGWRLMAGTDLPNSGVTAATYGDGTHVAQVAVNAQGLVTSAANVAITGGSGTVTSVSSGDSSIVVTNPTTTPGLQLASLSTIATNEPPSANWSNNSHKITSLANGSASSDAAAFGQIPTALPPNGSAGGNLGGTYPNPSVAGMTETGGPTSLTLGAVATGQYLRRSGTSIVGDSGANVTLTTVDATISSPVTMVNQNQFYDGPSASFAAGTWFIVWTLGVRVLVTTAQTYQYEARLWDGTTVYSEAEDNIGAGTATNLVGWMTQLAGVAVVTLGSPTTLKISAACIRPTSSSEITVNPKNNSGGSNTVTRLSGLKVG